MGEAAYDIDTTKNLAMRKGTAKEIVRGGYLLKPSWGITRHLMLYEKHWGIWITNMRHYSFFTVLVPDN